MRTMHNPVTEPAIRPPQRGFSIAVILTAVFLLGALGMALTLAEATGAMTSEDNKNKVLAAVILRQAAVWQDALVAATQTQGKWVSDATVSSIQDPQSGFMEPQNPPVDAYVNAANATWLYQSGNIKLMNVGTSLGEILVSTGNLKKGVCQQINNLLTGSTAINVETAGTSSGWETTSGASMDLSGETAVNGILQQCVQTTDGQYVFYLVAEPI